MDTIPALLATPLNIFIMKKLNVFGIEMTSLQEMRFSKYLENNRIAMNTYYKEQRTQITKKWFDEYKRLKERA